MGIIDQNKTLGQRVDDLGFTGKDFHCIACHIAQLQQFEWGNFDSSYACEICIYHDSCGAEKSFGEEVKRRLLDCWEAFLKLNELSGVEITPMPNRNNSLKRKMQWMEEKIAALEEQVSGQQMNIGVNES